MNKRIVVGILLALLSLPLSACSAVNDIFSDMGYSKSETTVPIKKIYSSYSNDGSDELTENTYDYGYDVRGNRISEVSDGACVYDAQGNLVSEHEYGALAITYSYDDDNRLLREENATSGLINSYVYDESGNLVSKCEMDGFGTVTTSYSYDDNGYVSRATDVYSLENVLPNSASNYEDGDTSTTTYSYDLYGHTTMESVVYKGLDGLAYSITRTYSYAPASGLLKEESYAYDGETAFSWTKEYSYDEAGNILTETTTDHNGNTIYLSHTYTYDATGNIIVDEGESVSSSMLSTGYRGVQTYYQHSPERSSQCIKRTYDVHGNILTEETTMGTLDRITYVAYSYDDDGNLLSEEECCYDSDGNPLQNRTVTEYEYAVIEIE